MFCSLTGNRPPDRTSAFSEGKSPLPQSACLVLSHKKKKPTNKKKRPAGAGAPAPGGNRADGATA